jgi:hypothetical protein
MPPRHPSTPTGRRPTSPGVLGWPKSGFLLVPSVRSSVCSPRGKDFHPRRACTMPPGPEMRTPPGGGVRARRAQLVGGDRVRSVPLQGDFAETSCSDVCPCSVGVLGTSRFWGSCSVTDQAAVGETTARISTRSVFLIATRIADRFSMVGLPARESIR